MNLFENFFSDLGKFQLSKFEQQFRDTLATRFDTKRHGDWPNWDSALKAMPDISVDSYDLNRDRIKIGSAGQLDNEQRAVLLNSLKNLHPWRKGPYELFGIHIDTEWRSDWKWQRIAPHLSDLHDRCVLDVGGGNAYHAWRMRGAGARAVLCADPSAKFLVQFAAFKKYLPEEPVHFLPLRCEDLPGKMRRFDSVFSMGVLYHRRSPFDHLEELKDCLRPGGELVLETLVVEGDADTVLVPPDRYAKMPNVWCLPSCAALERWLAKMGFCNIRCVDKNITSLEEQRATEWMTFQSLVDFLDPSDHSRTYEGHPAPMRAVMIANAPE